MKIKTFPLWAVVKAVLLAIIVSFYLFPVGFKGLPESLNTKQMLAAFGVVLFILRAAAGKGLNFNVRFFCSFLFAMAFSIWCYLVCTINNTADYAYAKYFLSFFVWIAGAYATVEIIKSAYGKVTLPMLTQFLAAVCIAQGILAILVDDIPTFASFVDKWFIQDTRPKQVDRLYGIGCSLDSGGVRMCFAEILIVHQLVTNKSLVGDRKKIILYVASLMVIAILGNIIARTTTVGLLLGGAYYVYYINKIKSGRISTRQMMIKRWVIFLTIVAFAGAAYMYNHNADFHKDMRFAFEGFFNLFEKGEFTTGSTEVLNERMWVWPTDLRGWMIGYGLFEWDYWYSSGYQTDIGYCRFTLYCGLIGLAIFGLYFIYNASIVRRKFKDARVLALVLVALTFIIWIKVSTDIFQLYALLFCLPGDGEDSPPAVEDADPQAPDKQI